MRIGIFFGGPSREREISFAGGKTAFGHLDKSLFTAVPVFVDSFGRFIRLNPKWMYEKGIRSFYPPQSAPFSLYAESFPELRKSEIAPEIGERLQPEDFSSHFDFALLAMHGPDCEDGAIQGLLEWYRIPYSGPGIMGSAAGIDKILQNKMIARVNRQQKKTATLSYADWTGGDGKAIFERLKAELGLPIVIKAPHQGSSIGVSIIKNDSLDDFKKGVNQCFFRMEISAADWKQLSAQDRQEAAQKIAHLDEGIGYPVELVETSEYICHPLALIGALDACFEGKRATATLLSANAEEVILFEEFVEGQEFSCGCIQDPDGRYVALPPTEIVKVSEVFDFNSKYRPGATRKRIPIDTSFENNRRAQENVAEVAEGLGIDVCVRIDGFLTPGGDILLHDPNTIPGMSPTSLIFKQMAEIGLNVTQTITYFIRQSIRQRLNNGKDTVRLRAQLQALDRKISEGNRKFRPEQIRVVEATEEDFEQARAWWGEVNAEGKYRPVVILKLDGKFYRMTVPLMFREYIEDVRGVLEGAPDRLLEETRKKAIRITEFFGGSTNFDAEAIREGDWMTDR